jgi:hypothetical protein
MNTFEDLSIIHEGTRACPSLIIGLKIALQQRIKTTVIHWRTSGEEYNILSGGTRIVKKTDGWGAKCRSTDSIADTISYCQMRVNILDSSETPSGSGIFFGVVNSDSMESSLWSGPSVMCVYSKSGTSLDKRSVEHVKEFNTKDGDVLSMVVDLNEDQLRFYQNTELIAIGKQKPSILMPLYAITWLFYNKCDVEMGDFIPYTLLERPKK